MECFDLIVFGGDGDLSFRKIYPALYHRLNEGQISEQSRILAVSRKSYDEGEFEEIFSKEIKRHVPDFDPKKLDTLMTMVVHGSINVELGEESPAVADWFGSASIDNRVFYLATPSAVFGPICTYLSSRGYISDSSKVVMEKPLGTDLESSEEINRLVAKYFSEDRIYRIDHYLGKETVQNLMVLRFANSLFESSWNAKYIDHVQITVSESIGVGTRGGFYDNYGALRDMVQNHLLQLLCLIAMEPPVRLGPDEVRDEKLKVLKALRFYDAESVLENTSRGQYTRGNTDEGPLMSYLEEIDKYDSGTETFVALKTYIDNWRWGGVPFYLRTGKRMPERYSEIIVNFKRVPHNLFPNKNDIENNRLTIRLQPEERIELKQMVKIPGPGGYRYKPFSLELDFADHFKNRFPEAYERLLIDVVRGDQTLFMRRDEVKASWEWIESITDHWESQKMGNILYEAGSWGPGDDVMDPEHNWAEPRHIDLNDRRKIAKG